MEKLQGPINSCLVAEHLEVGWLDEFINNSANSNFEDPCNTNEDGNFYEQDYNFPNLENKVPFLQMLQNFGPSYHPFQLEHEQKAASFPTLMQLEPNFQLLFRLQHQKLDSNKKSQHDIVPSKWSLEKVDSTHVEPYSFNNNIDFQDLHSPEVKSESEVIHQEVLATVVVENVGKPLGNTCNSIGGFNNEFVGDEYEKTLLKTVSSNTNQKEKKKRKRSSTRPAKNKQEIESQRMTHIAVERNRRRQMNEHLNALRSLMPSFYVQKGDQASIIGGAIDFVKELEQMLQSLEAQKRMKQYEGNGDVSINSSSTSNSHLGNFFTPFQPSFHSREQGNGNANDASGNENENTEKNMYVTRNNNEELSAIKRSSLADIEVVVIQNHVNLKIQCQRRPSQLFNVIVAFEELRLTVLHLNITSLDVTLVHYSFNLKIEDDCKLSTADDVARAVHQIFSLINIS